MLKTDNRNIIIAETDGIWVSFSDMIKKRKRITNTRNYLTLYPRNERSKEIDLD